MEWDDLCQEDVFTFAGVQFSDENLERLAELYLTFPSRFEFETQDLNGRFERIVSKSPRMLELRRDAEQDMEDRLEAEGLTDFPPFDQVREALGDFARRVEVACGCGAGDLLLVQDGDIIVLAPKTSDSLSFEQIGTVLALLERRAPAIEFRISGQDAG